MNEIKINGRVLYPLTIVMDRYTGTYSGGEYSAWNHEPKEIPADINGEDTEARRAWAVLENSEVYRSRFRFGVGNTIADALTALTEDIEKRGFAPEEDDLVAVVRCKDCRHRPVEVDDGICVDVRSMVEGDDTCPCLCDDSFYSYVPDDNFYCAKGERKRTRND